MDIVGRDSSAVAPVCVAEEPGKSLHVDEKGSDGPRNASRRGQCLGKECGFRTPSVRVRNQLRHRCLE